MKPIIKWPGGKSRDLKEIEAYLPRSDLWVEPFAGGGAFFFRLEPPEALLNDAERDLADFYRAVRKADPYLERALLVLARDRKALASLATKRAEEFADLMHGLRTWTLPVSALTPRFDRAGSRLALRVEDLDGFLSRSVFSKAQRLLGLERKHGKVFGTDELPPHLDTALQAGYYTAVRDAFAPRSRAEEIARFYFLREFCYGSMFRYSKDGKFNIPYGGISYNRIDFRAKVGRLYSGDVRELLHRAEIHGEDFEEFLDRIEDRLDSRAFVFLDPPYDTEFSSYANRPFGREEQDRLAAVFEALPCPALLVVQETEHIRALYEAVGKRRRAAGLPFFLTTYGKTYGYNVRGRNERRANHLLIGNYTRPRRK